MSSGEKTVQIQKRLKINKNTTHDCAVDMHIKSASLWKIDKAKHIWTLIAYTFTFGIIYVCTYIWPTLYIFLSCIPAEIDDAEYIVITDNQDHKSLEIILKDDFLYELDEEEEGQTPRNKEEIYQKIKDSLYFQRGEKVSPEERERRNTVRRTIQKGETVNDKAFIYLSNKYKYDDREAMFVPCTMYLNRYTKRELISMKKGICDLDIYNYLRFIYPRNEIELKNASVLMTLLFECCSPQYFYILASIIIWIFNEYWMMSIVISIFTIILITISTKRKVEAARKIINNEGSFPVRVIRPFEASIEDMNIEASEIVPGDCVILEKLDPSDKTPIKVPCDGVILQGYCTVNESDLTGENTLVFRKELVNDNEIFNYQSDKASFLFQGTTVSSLYSYQTKKSQIILLATGTGYNTYRGNMIKNWEYQNPKKKGVNFDYVILGIVIFLIWIFSGILFFVFMTEEYDSDEGEFVKLSIWSRLKYSIDNITVVLPPTLPICISFSRLYFNKKLKEKNISCVIEEKIDLAGQVDVIVLDKTGTLTESQLGIQCYKSTHLDETTSQLSLGDEELTPSTLNKIYKRFWQHIYEEKLKCDIKKQQMDYSYQNLSKFNIIYFTECLASCHYIYRIKGQNFGNSLDQKLFEEMNWEIIQEKDDVNSEIYIQPHNAYKITENVIFGEKPLKHYETNFCLKYLQRYEFMSQFQSMTVVVRNSIDGSIRVYTKGAPEKVKQICMADTLPVDLDDQLRKYTGGGYRVLACACRQIESFDKKSHTAEILEDGMTFLGLIVFKNQIKRDTKEFIESLQNAKCKLVIATGDNVLTTVSVAQQCGILKYENDIYNLDTLEKRDTALILTHTNYKENNDSKMGKKKLGSSSEENSVLSNSSANFQDGYVIENVDINVFTNEIECIINDPMAILCCSGAALSLILKKCEKVSGQKFVLEQLLLKKGKIFYRMLPDNKSSLIGFFKKDQTTIVSMCGDGANDCSAFMTSDVGVAIKQNDGNTLTSHFYHSKESIGCLEDIIKNGRACFENQVLITKFMILYSCIQITNVLFTTVNGQDINITQYLFMDVFCSLIPTLIASRTMANFHLTKKKPPKSMFNLTFVLGVIGQACLQVGSQLGYGFFIKSKTIDLEVDRTPRAEMNVFTTYMYIFALFQYLTVLLCFNSNSIHRKPFYSNRFYLFYASGIVFICILFVSIKEIPKMIPGIHLILFENDTQNFEKRLESNKALTIVWAMGLFIISFSYEAFIFYLLENE